VEIAGMRAPNGGTEKLTVASGVRVAATTRNGVAVEFDQRTNGGSFIQLCGMKGDLKGVGMLRPVIFAENVVRFFDTDESGYVARSEFVEACTKLNLSTKKAGSLFHMLDSGGDGEISTEEIGLLGFPRRPPEVAATPAEIRRVSRIDAGRNAVNSFRTFLRRQFGGLINAWRLLDSNKSGALTFFEFCASARGVGFHGNLKDLWEALDADETGSITLAELAPKEVQEITEFSELLSGFFDSLDEAWHFALDCDGSGRCTSDEFVKVAETLGYSGNGRRLFQYFDNERRDLIVIDELALLEMRRLEGHKVDELRRKRRWWPPDEIMDALRMCLRSKYSSVTRGWAEGFRGTLKEELFAKDVCRRCRELGFTENYWCLWRAVRDTGHVGLSLRLLDSDGYRVLNDFRSFLHTKGGFTVRSAWEMVAGEVAQRHVSLRLTQVKLDVSQFVQRLFALGYAGDTHADLLFLYLDGSGNSMVGYEDFERLGLAPDTNVADSETVKAVARRAQLRVERGLAGTSPAVRSTLEIIQSGRKIRQIMRVLGSLSVTLDQPTPEKPASVAAVEPMTVDLVQLDSEPVIEASPANFRRKSLVAPEGRRRRLALKQPSYGFAVPEESEAPVLPSLGWHQPAGAGAGTPVDPSPAGSTPQSGRASEGGFPAFLEHEEDSEESPRKILSPRRLGRKQAGQKPALTRIPTFAMQRNVSATPRQRPPPLQTGRSRGETPRSKRTPRGGAPTPGSARAAPSRSGTKRLGTSPDASPGAASSQGTATPGTAKRGRRVGILAIAKGLETPGTMRRIKRIVTRNEHVEQLALTALADLAEPEVKAKREQAVRVLQRLCRANKIFKKPAALMSLVPARAAVAEGSASEKFRRHSVASGYADFSLVVGHSHVRPLRRPNSLGGDVQKEYTVHERSVKAGDHTPRMHPRSMPDARDVARQARNIGKVVPLDSN